MPRYEFEREYRTPQSEVYVITAEGAPIGRVDLHFGDDTVHGTLCVPEDYTEDNIQELIGEVDERLVMSAQPFRDDFVVTVWIGRQAGVYSEEFDDYEDEDVEGNGHLE